MTTTSPAAQHELALEVVKRLREAGFQALWAGGCVRDRLLGRTPNDYDVATSATPPEIRALFGRRRTLEIGAAFGVVAVLGHHRAGMVEVSTFRRDTEYSDGRHPDAVVFSTPEDDAQRRDFTINGLFFDPLEERIIDYVGGVDDLQRGLVRAIGDARARIAEDKLRMIRAVRIAAGFGFALDEATQAAIEEMADSIVVVSPERIAQEMRKILTQQHRTESLELLHRTRLFAVLMPELTVLLPATGASPSAGGRGAEDLWGHTARVLEALVEPNFPLALAALVHALAEPSGTVESTGGERAQNVAVATAAAICARWRLSNKEHDRVTWLVGHHGRLAHAATQPWSALQPLLIAPGTAELVALWEAEGVARGTDAAKKIIADVEFCRAKLALAPEALNPQPLISGDDLVALGVEKSPIYRRLLQRVRAAQLDGAVRSRDEALAMVPRLLAEDQNPDSNPDAE